MNYFKSFKNTTPYQDINLVLEELSLGLQKILGFNLHGLYLFGSLVYGDFKEGSSDIDLVAIVKQPLNELELERVKDLHQVLSAHHPKWQERLECSYTPIHMLVNTLPPKEPRPYYGGGIFYADADYGNEWIINNYLLNLHSIALIGPRFNSLVKPIEVSEVQKACIRDLFLEWAPKTNDLKWLENSHYQSYLILNLCRILYTVYCCKTGSKVVSATWVKEKHPQWKALIEAAEQWNYGREMHSLKEAINFIQFTIAEITKTELYKKINPTNCNVTKMETQHSEDMMRNLSDIQDPKQKSALINMKNEIKAELKDNFVGAYVHGSLATGDPVVWSDLDVVIVIKEDIPRDAITSVQKLHHKLYSELETPWGQRLELSYVPINIFRKRAIEPRDPINEPRSADWIDPSTQSPPQFYPFWYLDNGANELVRSEHDNTQIVRWTVREKGIVLEGPDPKTIIDPVNKADLVNDLKNTFNMIADKWNNPQSLNSLGMQTFFVTLCCRAQHCLNTGIISSKKVASEWAQKTLNTKYHNLIKSAYEIWLKDRSTLFVTPMDMNSVTLTMDFISETVLDLNNYSDG